MFISESKGDELRKALSVIPPTHTPIKGSMDVSVLLTTALRCKARELFKEH